MGEVKTRGRCRTPHLELAAARHSVRPGRLTPATNGPRIQAVAIWANEYASGRSSDRFFEPEENRATSLRGDNGIELTALHARCYKE